MARAIDTGAARGRFFWFFGHGAGGCLILPGGHAAHQGGFFFFFFFAAEPPGRGEAVALCHLHQCGLTRGIFGDRIGGWVSYRVDGVHCHTDSNTRTAHSRQEFLFFVESFVVLCGEGGLFLDTLRGTGTSRDGTPPSGDGLCLA